MPRAQVLMQQALHGEALSAPVPDLVDLEGHYSDGMNNYQYLAGSPLLHSDPLGLFLFPDPTDLITGMLEALVTDYAENLDDDVEWATRWDHPDDDHSRIDNGWLDYALGRGIYDAFYIGIPGTDIRGHPLDEFAGSSSGVRTGRRSGKIVAGETIHTKRGREVHRQYADDWFAKGWLPEESVPGVRRRDAFDFNPRIVREVKPNTPQGAIVGCVNCSYILND